MNSNNRTIPNVASTPAGSRPLGRRPHQTATVDQNAINADFERRLQEMKAENEALRRELESRNAVSSNPSTSAAMRGTAEYDTRLAVCHS